MATILKSIFRGGEGDKGMAHSPSFEDFSLGTGADGMIMSFGSHLFGALFQRLLQFSFCTSLLQ
jgi:hypothetical protein